jgi:predicted TPR repeat methyltransferase
MTTRNTTEELHQQADSLLNVSRMIEARAIYEKICILDENDADAWFMKGAIDGEMGKVDQAVLHVRKAIAIEPDYAEAHYALARLLVSSGATEEARSSLQKAIELDPKYTEAWVMLAGLHGRSQNYPESEACSRLALQQDDSIVEAHMSLGNALSSQGKLKDAVAAYQAAVQLQPGLSIAWARSGDLLLQLNDFDAAEGALVTALNLDPDDLHALICLTWTLIKLGRNEDAVAASLRAIEINPGSVEAHYNLGSALKNLGRMEAALGACAHAVHLNQDSAEAHGNLGTVLFNLGRREEALSSYERAIEIKADFAEAYECRGSVLMELGHQDEARVSFQTALEFKPQLITSKYYLATLGFAETPSQSPRDYVVGLFDSYAGRFDQHLVEVLGYRAPVQLYEAVSRHIDIKAVAGSLDVLDLGCGTGLCGVAFAELARTLVGVDLAPLMIARARMRNLYTDLIQGEICDILERESGFYDLIISADVFIYIGDLEKVFALARERLTATGLFAFSLEHHEGGEDYVLRSTGRYAQSTEYMKRLAAVNALDILSDTPVTLRYQGDLPIAGRVMILRRSGDRIE